MTYNTLDPIALFDGGFGEYMVPVAPPNAVISPDAMANFPAKERGKIPAVLTHSGWSKPKGWLNSTCPDMRTALLWRDIWNANIGLKSGRILGIDNDIGVPVTELLRDLLQAVGVNPLRRIVFDPRHHRDLFALRVVDDILGEPLEIRSRDLTFHQGMQKGQIQLLGVGKQFVCYGVHPGTKSPYAWDREIHNFADIPSITEHTLNGVLSTFLSKFEVRGWHLSSKPVSSLVSTKSAEVEAPGGLAANQNPIKSTYTESQKQEAADILAWLVNRDVPVGETPTDIDRHFDDYGNYVQIAYAIFAVWGDDGYGIWLEWAHGRDQPKQKPEYVWASVRNNPHIEAGLHTFQQLAQQFRPNYLAERRFRNVPVDPELEGPQGPEPRVSKSQNGPTPCWDEIKSRWIFVVAQDRYIDTLIGKPIKRTAFNAALTALVPAVMAELHPNYQGKPLDMSVIFARTPGPIVQDVTYAPGDPPMVPLVNAKGECDFNRWRPTEYGTTKNVTPEMIKPYLDHVHYLLDTHAELFLQWCAWVVQNPRLKPNWHFLIMSLEGMGKDMMTLPFKLAVGEGNFMAGDIGQLISDFHYALEHKLIVVSETWDKERHGAVTKLKKILANPPEMLSINLKNLAQYEIPNRQAVLMFSNEANPLRLDEKQRRIYVANRKHIAPRDATYYQTLQDWLDNGGKELAASYLLHMPLDASVTGRMLGRAPDSPDTKELEHINRDPVHEAVDDFLEEARAGGGNFPSLLATSSQILDHIANDLPWRCTSRRVGSYLRELEQEGKGVSRVLREADGRAGVVSAGGERARLWYLADKTPEGGPWGALSNAELLARWLNRPAPPSATVTPIRQRQLAAVPVPNIPPTI